MESLTNEQHFQESVVSMYPRSYHIEITTSDDIRVSED